MSKIITIKESNQLSGEYRQISSDEVEFRYKDKNYQARIRPQENERNFEVLLNGRSYKVEVKNDLDDLISKMGLNVLDEKDVGDIYSPMPGLVLDVMVEKGQLVEAGESLLILEAMKMENIIKAAGKGIVNEITISKGDKVEKGQLLISIVSGE